MSASPDQDVRRAAAVLWRALVLCWAGGSAVAAAAGGGSTALLAVGWRW